LEEQQNIKKEPEGLACCRVGGRVHLVYKIGHYNGIVKFECNDRYHCIRIMILNEDDLFYIYRKNERYIYIYIDLYRKKYYNNLIYRKQSSKNLHLDIISI
jgi:hypothetical protein